ncbi:MAG: glycosyltransferase family 39 protein [Deltaproteobacteria bacterium]|nr:glycosyltransferase family 39 protein [Deltaproteobacteria bacterium]
MTAGMPSTTRNIDGWAMLALGAVVVALLLRLAMVTVPFERDEGGYAYVAWLWHAGGTPYVDVIDSKPPGLFIFYALVFFISQTVAAVRLALALWTVLTTWLMYRLGRRCFSREIGCAAAALYALTCAAPAYFGFSANAEIFLAGFVTAALLVLRNPDGEITARRGAASGALVAAAVLFKPVALADALPIAFLLMTIPAVGFAARLRAASLFAAGFAATIALCVSFFSFAGDGSLDVFWRWSFGYGFTSYTGAFTALDRVKVFIHVLLTRNMVVRDWPVAVAVVLGGVAAIRRARAESRWLNAFPILWFVSAFIGVSASGRYTPHYFQQVIPPAALLGAIGMVGVAAWAKERKRMAVFAAGILVFAYPTATQLPLAAQGPALSRTLFGLNPFVEGEEIGRYLHERTDPGDRVYIVGSEPQFLFHAKRRNASRFIFSSRCRARIRWRKLGSMMFSRKCKTRRPATS